MATRMQQRRGTAAQWTAANPILAAGEIGFETDTSKFKMGNGSSTWSALQYFANAAELAAIIDGAPGLLNTLDELALAMGDDPAFLTTIATNLSNHATDTTDIHGIANTALLATTAAVNTAISISAGASSQDATAKANGAEAAAIANAAGALTAHEADTTNVHGIADTSVLATATTVATAKSEAIAALTAHEADTTNIHGIADTAALATTAATASAITTAVSSHEADTTSVHGIADTSLLATTANITNAISALTKSAVGLDQVNNTSDANKPVSTATGTAISTAVSDHNADTTNVHGIADTSVLVTQTELTNAINGAEVTQSDLAGTGLVWDSVNSEFDLDNTYITTATQTALDLKAPLASPTFTGTVSGITKTMVGLGSADNTADTAKPVSTAQASAIATAKAEAIADATSQVNALLTGAPAALNTLDELAAALGDDANFASTVTTSLGLKAPLASPTFTGTVTVAAAGVAFTDGTQTKAGVPSITNIPTAIAAGAHALAAGRADQFIPLTGAVVITLPATGYSTGQSIDFYQESGTGASFASTNSVVGTPGRNFRTTNSVVTAMKTAAGWLVFGDLSA
jgi:hypothetical protein